MNYYSTLGYNVTVVTGTLEGDVNSHKLLPDINLKELSFRSAKTALPSLIRFVRTEQFEYAFAFNPELAIVILVSRFLTKKRFRIICRCINTLKVEYMLSESFFRRHITYMIVKLALKRTDLVVAQSDNMRKDLIENFGISANRVITINNPLDVRFEGEIKSRNKINKKNYILYVGRFEKQKGLDMLIRAFGSLHNESVELYLVGKGTLQISLEELAKELGISSRVKFVPFTEEVERFYKEAKVTILTSYYEGFPNVLIESLACGTPVVSFDSPSGPNEIIIDGENGFLVKYLDTNDLVLKIKKALIYEWDYDFVKESANKFTIEAIMYKYKSLLRQDK